MVTADYAAIPDRATSGSLPPGGLTGRLPDVVQLDWDRQDEEVGAPLPGSQGGSSLQLRTNRKKKSPKKGYGGQTGVADATAKATREATEKRERERKAASDAEEDVERETAAAAAAATAAKSARSDAAEEFQFGKGHEEEEDEESADGDNNNDDKDGNDNDNDNTYYSQREADSENDDMGGNNRIIGEVTFEGDDTRDLFNANLISQRDE